MRGEDIPSGLRLCRAANWNQTAADWERFLAVNPDGSRVAVSDSGRVVGTVATISYGNSFSWIGMVLVDPSVRRTGIGTRLLNEAMAVLGNASNIRLDATPAGRTVYFPLGFSDEYELQRLERAPQAFDVAPETPVRRMSDADFEDVSRLDIKAFGADRRELLGLLRRDAPEYAWVSGVDCVVGYVFGRHGYAFEHIGPVVAPNEGAASSLVAACLSVQHDRSLILDTPRRASWLDWLESVGFRPQRPFMRMCRGDRTFRERVEQMFAIAGPEFG